MTHDVCLRLADCNDSLSFVREPPDGCEKVVVEEARSVTLSSHFLNVFIEKSVYFTIGEFNESL